MDEKIISEKEQLLVLKTCMISMAVESWRMFKVLERLLCSLDTKEQTRYQSKIRWFIKKTEESLSIAGLKIVNYEGAIYDPGIPAAPINLDEFSPEDKLCVSQMLEPVIVDKSGVIVKTGTIFLRKVQ